MRIREYDCGNQTQYTAYGIITFSVLAVIMAYHSIYTVGAMFQYFTVNVWEWISGRDNPVNNIAAN